MVVLAIVIVVVGGAVVVVGISAAFEPHAANNPMNTTSQTRLIETMLRKTDAPMTRFLGGSPCRRDFRPPVSLTARQAATRIIFDANLQCPVLRPPAQGEGILHAALSRIKRHGDPLEHIPIGPGGRQTGDPSDPELHDDRLTAPTKFVPPACAGRSVRT